MILALSLRAKMGLPECPYPIGVVIARRRMARHWQPLRPALSLRLRKHAHAS